MKPRVLLAAGVLLILAAVVIALLGGRDPDTPPAPEDHIAADVGAPITHVVLSLNSARRSALRNVAVATNIVNALPSRVRVLLLSNDRAAFTVARNPWPDRVVFVEVPGDTAITIWPQDPFLVLHRPEHSPRLLISREFSRAGDRAMGEVLAEHLGWEATISRFRFEGGNIVADEHTAFVGVETILINAAELETADTEVVLGLERELGRPILVIGPLPQLFGHIDMILTPLGRDRLALADPGAGAELAARAQEESPEEVLAFETHCRESFFGDPGITELHDADGKVIRPPPVRGETSAAVAHSRELAAKFDTLARTLEARGYEVIRIPFLFAAPETPSDEDEEPAHPGPGYPVLTWNNALIESAEERQTVYLPEYGWPRLDRAAADAWRSAGYTVHPVPGLTVSAMYGGALRCNVKVLERAE